MFVGAIVVGFGQGFQPFCGFCYGARLYGRLREGYWFCVRTGTVILLVMTVICAIFSSEAIWLFRNDAEVIAIGTTALRWQVCTWPLTAIIIISNMLMQTCRKPLPANILAAARRGLFFIPLILILPHFFGLLGVEMCQAWSDVLAFAITIPIVRRFFKELPKE